MNAETVAAAREVNGGGEPIRVPVVVQPSPFVIALRALEVSGRLHDAVALAGALFLFIWLAAQPDTLRLLGALGFSLVALALRWLRTHGGS